MTSSATQEQGSRPRLALRPALTVAALALPVNLVVWLGGWAANVDFRLTMNSYTVTITPIHVLLTTLIGLALGAAAASLVRRWGPVAWRTLAIVGAAVGVLSASTPIQADSDPTTAAALATMHVLTGLIWLVALWRAAAAAQVGFGSQR